MLIEIRHLGTPDKYQTCCNQICFFSTHSISVDSSSGKASGLKLKYQALLVFPAQSPLALCVPMSRANIGSTITLLINNKVR